MSLGDVIHWLKTVTTRRYADGVKESRWTPFSGRLWQRNYYDRIVRDEDELSRIREYIAVNPARWAEDEYNIVSPLLS
jgi:REP element-mobilizing transposase RayT